MIAACGNHINSKKSQIAVADPTAIQKNKKGRPKSPYG